MTTEADYWRRLEALCERAATLAAHERKAFLDAECPDPRLRRDVEDVLGGDEDPATGIARLISDESQRIASDGVPSGAMIGPYRVVRFIAEGGMGAVYLAERADGQFQQEVAIKLMRSAAHGTALGNRFLHERQILADLNHPNIARLLDGGVTEAGQPYLVMEYIAGQTIDDYCRERTVPLAERLHLVQKVCAAVQAAHLRLIVHRDIKPSNIIVDPSGEPKLLDFGIAKLLEPDGQAGDSPETQAGHRMMTPEYASPEQVLGQPVGTASDVYSLGVLLYRLLTGRSPYERWLTQPLELMKAICETDPPRPSETVRNADAGRPVQIAARLRRKLQGDLDHIVLKAMRKEPSQRYSSPAALAEDLQRFQENQPILARRGSRRYVVAKFLRRNALAVASAAAAALILAVLVVFYTLRLQAERDVAQIERAAAEKTTEFLVSLFTAGNPNEQRPDVLARDILQRGAERISGELAGQPLVEARLQQAIGKAFWSLHLFDEGEARMKRALGLMRKHLPADDPRLALLLSELGGALTLRERYDEGLGFLEEALAIDERVYGPADLRVAQRLYSIDVIRSQQRDVSDERRRRLERIEQIYRANQRTETRDFVALLMLRHSFHKLRFEWAAAQDATAEALRILDLMGQSDQWTAAFPWEDAGRLDYFVGDYASARPKFAHAIGIVESYKGPDSVDMTWATYFMGRIEREFGKLGQAREWMERTARIETATPLTEDLRYLARALCGRALVLADLGELEAAERDCRRGFEILAPTLPHQQRVQMDVIHEGLGIIALARGDTRTALEHLEAMAGVRRLEVDPGQTDTPLAIGLHASALAAGGRVQEAEALFAESIALAEQRYHLDYPTIGRVLWARAFLRERTGDATGAEADRERARGIFDKAGIVPQSESWTVLARTD